ncbi:sensor histidine kinase [Lachnospiraceae bacterium OttesenSCG-928-E19]|nr:sensor histidine kinase [Lachnospiraceae bacterium OttesenSCG-928-E19]
MKKSNSIGRKLNLVFLVVFGIVFLVNAFTYYSLNRAISRIDNVYSSNIQLNDLMENLENVQSYLYQYLSTKSSESLESYYEFEQDYRDNIEELNIDILNDSNSLMEKNIFYLSDTYLESANKAVEAKRGRDVSRYKEAYEESEKIYGYIQTNISSMNTTVFLHNAKDYSVLRGVLNYIMIFGIASLCVVIIMAVVWTVSMTGSITKPLVELGNAANEIAKGNMNVDFPIVETGDEVSAVAKACNKMIASIRSYIEETKENYKRESKLKENELSMKSDLKEAQLKYLQAQINPHFLFNSLNAGSQLAMMEGAEKACLFIENMADFFRYNVRKMDKTTTLREELDLVDNYIHILNVRFSGEIHYARNIDERWLDHEMPGMIIQPIIENAVNHGIREMNGDGSIHLSVYSSEGDVCIKVTDNGKGVDPDKAARIMRGESVRSKTQRDSAGIGLDNVISRLRSYFEREEVFVIRPLEKGTEIILCMPKVRGEADDEDINLR